MYPRSRIYKSEKALPEYKSCVFSSLFAKQPNFAMYFLLLSLGVSSNDDNS
jgi:hypothetical protein